MTEAQPSRTALRMALRRAAHQLVDAPPLIFPDPYAIPLLGPEAHELERVPKAARKPFSAALRAWVVARARYAEDVLAAAIVGPSPARQYLVLGAGLDTFALRNPYPGLRVFEVDHPATQGWKRERLLAAGLALPTNAALVPVDFETDSLARQLALADFRADLPTITAWLGVVPYLTPEGFAATCRVLGGFAPASHIIFDYSQPREALPPVEQLMHDSLAARVAQAGEPFQLFFTPEVLEAGLARYGLGVEEDLGSAELNARYFMGRSDGLLLRGTAGKLCHAQVRLH